MKRSRSNVIFIIVVILGILGVAAFYIYDVFYLKTSYTTSLFRVLAAILLLLGTLIRLLSSRGRKRLDVYERAYQDELGYAFKNKPIARKKLLSACRLYDESNYRKAIKYLHELLQEAEFERDLIPVLLFMALCYSDAGLTEDAVNVYYDLLKYDPNNAQVNSNMGTLYIKQGDYQTALKYYTKSIECKPDYIAYLNRANCYFRLHEYDMAIDDAKKALEIKNNGVEAADLLTVIYALRNDEENRRKYYHIALVSGKSPEELDEAICYFLNENKSFNITEKSNEGLSNSN